jgi:putative toxin-antitoxin system antitoxin component (TIGR02293 family)
MQHGRIEPPRQGYRRNGDTRLLARTDRFGFKIRAMGSSPATTGLDHLSRSIHVNAYLLRLSVSFHLPSPAERCLRQPLTVHSLRARANLSDAETYQLIAPRRTLKRREAPGQILSSEEADKAVRVARITARALQVFAGQPAYAAAWLRDPKSSLGDRTPLQLLATESGALAVEEQLVGIENDMFA